MIMETGPSPNDLTIAVGDTVTFMNHDSVPHGVAGGSDPARPDCPEINAVGVLLPGEIRSTMPFTTAKTCEYHDPRVTSATFNGRIVIR
jgi:plastocyanin